MPSDEEWLTRLIRLHDAELPNLRRLDSYYEGTQPLSYMHPELVAQLEGQVRQVVINWPQLVVDAVEERLNIEGFCRPDQASGDDDLWNIWEANDMDSGSQQVHVEALALSRSYVTVGTPDDKGDPPVICDESALDMIHVTDPRTREVAAAVRRWSDDGSTESASEADRSTLYLPGKTNVYGKEKSGAWKLISEDKHDVGKALAVPILNRARRKKPLGVSELNSVLPLSDAACKIATDMMVGSNFHALPQYAATGVSEEDFVDEGGNPVSVWKRIVSRIWATENKDAKFHTFAASDLSNFHKTLVALAQLVSSQYGLPPHYLGFSTDNPASAEGIKSSEARLNLRAERKQGMFDAGWEDVMRLAHRLYTGTWDPALRLLKTDWRDPSTPTIGQSTDAAVKGYQVGLVPKRYARKMMRFSDPQIRQMEEMDEQDAIDDPIAALARQVTPALSGATA